MEDKSLAKEIGARCRRVRMEKGLSQKELADMVPTTPQNISKYENNGISDIDMIHLLSEKLGQNLLTDEVDEEGSVGEIGREILWLLLRDGGHSNVDKLIKEEMHGMRKDRFSKEVFKLEKIGLCVTYEGIVTSKTLYVLNLMEWQVRDLRTSTCLF